jgi:hypothetical protein
MKNNIKRNLINMVKLRKLNCQRTFLLPSENIICFFISILRKNLRNVLKIQVAMILVRDMVRLKIIFARSIYPTLIGKIIFNGFIIQIGCYIV